MTCHISTGISCRVSGVAISSQWSTLKVEVGMPELSLPAGMYVHNYMPGSPLWDAEAQFAQPAPVHLPEW